MPFSSSSRTASSAPRRGVPPGGRQQTGRGFPERPDRVTRGVAHDLPARRVGRVGGDAGQLHRLLVGQRRMPAGVPQQDRVDGRHRTERVVERQPLDTGRWRRVPLVLMPAATADELAGAGASGRILDQRYDVRPARGAPQIELQRRVADSQEVAVPLDEPRNREAAVEIDDLCLVADVAVELGRATMRSPRTASASTSGIRSSTVTMVPFRSTRSACSTGGVAQLAATATPTRAMAASLSRAVILLNRIVQSLQQSLAGEARRP